MGLNTQSKSHPEVTCQQWANLLGNYSLAMRGEVLVW